MKYSRMTDRLTFDIKFLIWRAEVHLLSADEISNRYRAIEHHYLALAEQEEAAVIRREMQGWLPQIRQISSRNDRASAEVRH